MRTSSDVVVECEGLGKQYRISDGQRYATLRETIVNAASRLFLPGQPADEPMMIWALDDVSFELRRRDVLGIIGRNGAGKSTLLKVLSRITKPTRGRAVIRGRVGSLLEVGTGFHSELTGRENIFLNGAILGMRRADILRRFDAIVDFAEIGEFLDTPVKRYSSGMYMRLAFAVAAHLEPEILVIDEVLAVGDAQFQKKCLGKMGEASREGRTVLFVSHNLVAVEALCNTALWLDQGRVRAEGDAKAVVAQYSRTFSSSTEAERTWDEESAPGNEKVRVLRAAVRPQRGAPGDPITVQTPLSLEFEFFNYVPGASMAISVHLFNEEQVLVFDSGPPGNAPLEAGRYQSSCLVPGDLLNDGQYSITLNVNQDDRSIYSVENVVTFEVLDTPEMRGQWFGRWSGVIRPSLTWTTRRTDEYRPRAQQAG